MTDNRLCTPVQASCKDAHTCTSVCHNEGRKLLNTCVGPLHAACKIECVDKQKLEMCCVWVAIDAHALLVLTQCGLVPILLCF